MGKMEFACIVYRTKSGRIWKARENKPNYLCNPETEIDHTAYGTWTSALQGEHIPLIWITEGKTDLPMNELVKRQSFIGTRILNKIQSKVNNNCISIFSNIEYLNKFDLILLCLNYEVPNIFANLAKAIKNRFPAKIILTTHDFNLGRIREFWRNSNWFMNFRELINTTDAFLVSNPGVESYFGLVCDKPIIYFPQLYPVDHTRKYFKLNSEKDNVIFIGASTQRIDNVWSALLAKKIQSDFPQFIIKLIWTKDFNLEVLKNARFEILPRLSWEQYLSETSKSKLIINMDNWWTNGRVPTDAAAVGTPCIGVNSGRQVELFPSLSFNDIIGNANALETSRQLLNSEEIFQKVTCYSYKELQKYSYEEGTKRIRDLFNNLKTIHR